ncbi:cytochrome b [Agaribacterium sp. ZY112]|uniref:cytochrome b n=1 Tax=Agaribacterium sp. ZY112 TaxID=3233574 RepID=UPI0035248C73
MLKNSEQAYGLVSKTLHWLVALTVFGLFTVGLWMVELGYYDSWYQLAPHYHKSVGALLALVLLFRVLWRYVNPKVQPLSSHKVLEQKAAHLVHIALYLLMFMIFVSGYLISTADGRSIQVFNWFEIPALGSFIENQEDVAGDIHRYLAYSLISLIALHVLGALKHHFIDKDSTLKRML